MNFWDSSKGYHLAEVLIRTLPKLVESRDRRVVQYTMRAENLQIAIGYIDKEIAAGSRYIGHLQSDKDGPVLIIMENREQPHM